MKIELTKKDLFLDYILEQGPENPTHKVRDDLKDRGFWTEEELSNVLDKWLDREVMKYMRGLPEYDEYGNVIERIHVIRKTEDGRKDELYVQRSFLTYDDTVYAVKYRVGRSDYFLREARRIAEDAITSGRLTTKEVKKLKRTFQGLLDFEPAIA